MCFLMYKLFIEMLLFVFSSRIYKISLEFQCFVKKFVEEVFTRMTFSFDKVADFWKMFVRT